MKQVGMVVLMVLAAAIMPHLAQAEPVIIGVVPAISEPAPTQTPVQMLSQTTTAPISVSFTGANADVMRRAFKTEADNQGQLVVIKDWGGRYQVSLRPEIAPQKYDFRVQADKHGLGKYVRAAINGQETRQLVAEFRSGQDFLGSETTYASGLRTSVALGVFTQHGSLSGNAYNGWLGQSLDGQCIVKMVPVILARLQEFERAAASAEVRSERSVRYPGTSVAPERGEYCYTLMDSMNREKPRQVVLDRPLERDSEISVMRNGQRIGTLRVSYFDASRVKAWVSGDTQKLAAKGLKFTVL